MITIMMILPFYCFSHATDDFAVLRYFHCHCRHAIGWYCQLLKISHYAITGAISAATHISFAIDIVEGCWYYAAAATLRHEILSGHNTFADTLRCCCHTYATAFRRFHIIITLRHYYYFHYTHLLILLSSPPAFSPMSLITLIPSDIDFFFFIVLIITLILATLRHYDVLPHFDTVILRRHYAFQYYLLLPIDISSPGASLLGYAIACLLASDIASWGIDMPYGQLRRYASWQRRWRFSRRYSDTLPLPLADYTRYADTQPHRLIFHVSCWLLIDSHWLSFTIRWH